MSIDHLRIEQLADYPDLLPTVATWIYNEWWSEFDNQTVASVAGLLHDHLTRDRIPLTLVASSENKPVGTATLIDHDIGTEHWPELSPWMAALYVEPKYRHLGIGSALVNSVVSKATQLGKATVYLTTIDREAFYKSLGWVFVDRIDGQVVLSKLTARRF